MTVLGLAILADEVTAVLVRRRTVVWRDRAPFPTPDSIANSLSRVLSRVPTSKRGLRISAAVAPKWVQVKRLHGLPSLQAPRLLNQLVQENQQSFFLWKGSRLEVPEIDFGSKGEIWAAAFDREILNALVDAARSARLRISRVVPAVVAVASISPGQAFSWTDSDCQLVIEGDATGLRRVEWVSSAGLSGAEQAIAGGQERLDTEAPEFADAYAAAIMPRGVVMVWRPQPGDRERNAWVRLRKFAGGVLVAASAMFALIGPAVRAQRFAVSAHAELVRQSRYQLELARAQADLHRTTSILGRVEAFRADQGKVTRLVGELSQALPESTAILTIHVDSAEGTITAVAPHISDALTELGSVSDINGPRIVGSVTRETIGGVRLERASFRFRRVRAVRKSPSAVIR